MLRRTTFSALFCGLTATCEIAHASPGDSGWVETVITNAGYFGVSGADLETPDVTVNEGSAFAIEAISAAGAGIAEERYVNSVIANVRDRIRNEGKQYGIVEVDVYSNYAGVVLESYVGKEGIGATRKEVLANWFNDAPLASIIGANVSMLIFEVTASSSTPTSLGTLQYEYDNLSRDLRAVGEYFSNYEFAKRDLEVQCAGGLGSSSLINASGLPGASNERGSVMGAHEGFGSSGGHIGRGSGVGNRASEGQEGRGASGDARGKGPAMVPIEFEPISIHGEPHSNGSAGGDNGGGSDDGGHDLPGLLRPRNR